MEPIWLGLARPTVFSAASAVAHAAAQPFTVVLDAAGKMLDSSQGPAAATPVQDIRTQVDKLQYSLQRRIHQLVKNSGIKFEGEFQLRMSPVSGQIDVEGNSPQRAVLEAVLSSDPSIAADFRRLAAMHRLLNTADKHVGITETDASDLSQAVADLVELFDEGGQALLLLSMSATELRFEYSSVT